MLNITGLDYMEKLISVSLNQRKTANSEKSVDFDSSQSLEYAATDTPTCSIKIRARLQLRFTLAPDAAKNLIRL